MFLNCFLFCVRLCKNFKAFMDEKISIIVFFSIVAVLRPRSHVKMLLNCYRIKNMLKFIHRVIID
jgi:hypothetical protein